MGGPSGQYTFAWTGPNNFSSSLQNPTTNTSGAYTLVVTSGNNSCTASASVTVQQNTVAPTAAIAVPGNLNCNNNTVQLNATGSSQGANFTYLWTTTNGNIVSGGTTLTPIVSAVGTYQLVVTNTENACTSSVSTTVNQSPTITATASSANVSCNGGANGSATVSASGGNGAYAYLWSNGATTASISGLSAGSYLVTITDGENCTVSATAAVTQPNQLLANASATGETSLGAHNGTATASPAGGTPAYSYGWSNGGTTATITGLVPGSYTVTVGDAQGCTAIQTVTVNAFGCSLSASISATNATCNGANNGSASVALTGAATPVNYNWSNGATTQNITGLAPGTYTVSIVDGNNCPAILNTTVSEPTLVSANASSTNETASGANNGTATASPTGGSGVYTYLWSNGGTSASIMNLAPGSYIVSVTDSNNCIAIQTVTVSSFNCAINAAISGANVSCFGGNDGLATAVLSNGQLPYIYNWSNGGTSATINNLPAGSYTVTAHDAAGCVTTQSIVITEPAVLSAEASVIQNVVCPSDHTGAVGIVAVGGTLPYTFTGNLNNLAVGAHSVIVTDNNGCTTSVLFNIIATDNQPPVLSCPATIFMCGADLVSYPAPTITDNCSPFPAPVLISGQASGTAFDEGTTVQVFRATDATGNIGTCSFAVTVYPIPDILLDGFTNDQNGAGVGTISITAVGGAGGYFYAWKKNGQLFSNNADLSGLQAGSYTLTITDDNGCTTALAPVVITNTVGTNEPGNTGTIRLYPNPTATSFKLDIIDLDVVAAMILDIRGRNVYELQPLEWQNEIMVDELSTGVYFLRISTEKGRVITLKFVKTE